MLSHVKVLFRFRFSYQKEKMQSENGVSTAALHCRIVVNKRYYHFCEIRDRVSLFEFGSEDDMLSNLL